MGALYLLCYERDLSGAGNWHYLGYSARAVRKRIAQHASGTAAVVFTTEAHRQGIPFRVAGIWEGCTGRDERNVKRQKRHRAYCSICTPIGTRSIPVRSRAEYLDQVRRKPKTTATTRVYDDLEDLPF